MMGRFLNFLIDSIIFTIIAFFIVSILVKYHPSFQEYSPMNNRILAFILYFSYYFLFEIIFSATPGKIITKTKIVDKMTLVKPSIFKVFVRTISRFIPFEAFSIFFYSKNQTWHDIISRTMVINKL